MPPPAPSPSPEDWRGARARAAPARDDEAPTVAWMPPVEIPEAFAPAPVARPFDADEPGGPSATEDAPIPWASSDHGPNASAPSAEASPMVTELCGEELDPSLAAFAAAEARDALVSLGLMLSPASDAAGSEHFFRVHRASRDGDVAASTGPLRVQP